MDESWMNKISSINENWAMIEGRTVNESWTVNKRWRVDRKLKS